MTYLIKTCMFIYIYDISLITIQKYIIELYYSEKEMIIRLECFHICDPWLHFDGFLLIFFFFLSKSLSKWVNHFRTFILLLAGPIYLFRGRGANLNFWLYQGICHNINVNKAYFECSNSKAFLKLFFYYEFIPTML